MQKTYYSVSSITKVHCKDKKHVVLSKKQEKEVLANCESKYRWQSLIREFVFWKVKGIAFWS